MSLLAVYLVVSAYVRSIASVYPPNFGERDWRFGAFGFLLGDSPVAIMGLGILVAAAALAGKRGRIKGTAVVAAGFAVVSLAMVITFWQDGSSLIAAADANAKGYIGSTVRRTVSLGALNVLGFGAVAWGGMLAARGGDEPGDDPGLAVSRKG